MIGCGRISNFSGSMQQWVAQQEAFRRGGSASHGGNNGGNPGVAREYRWAASSGLAVIRSALGTVRPYIMKILK